MKYLRYCIILLLFSCNNEQQYFLNTSLDVDNVGMNQCAACHVTEYESFINTGMGKSFRPALRDYSSSIFDTILYDEKLKFHYNPHWVNDSLFVSEYSLVNNDTVHDLIYKVDYIIGSGHHTNSHLYQNNGYLYQTPFTYYTQDSILDFPPGFEGNSNSRFSRKMGLECVACHNAYPDFVLGSENKYNTIPLGIDCERCHGPGELHVEQIKSGNIIDTSKRVDYTIVNPSHLSIELQNDICARCHLQGNAVLHENKSFFDFRPGQYLREVMDVYLPRYSNSNNDFIMASHVDRMKLSACYLESNEGLSCIDCHNPHISVQEMPQNFFNNRCVSCHTEIVCTEEAVVKNKFNNDCVMCHMSNSTTIDIPHVTITDHKISIQNDEVILDTGLVKEFLGLECINNQDPSIESVIQAYLQQYERFEQYDYYLDSAFKYLNKIDINHKNHLYMSIYLAFLQEDYRQIIERVNSIGFVDLFEYHLQDKDYSNKDAWTSYRIGEAFFKQGDSKNALKFYQHAVTLAPYNLEFRNKYGNSLFFNQKIDFAIDEFEFILSEDNNFISAYTNLGFVYFSIGNLEDALSYYNYALELNPYHEKTLLNMASLYYYTDDVNVSIDYLNKVLHLYPGNQEAESLLYRINETIN